MNNLARIQSVGGFWGTIGNFFSSGIGQSLVTAGIGIGSAYLTNELVGPSSSSGSSGGSSTPAPAPAPPPVVIQQPAPAPAADNTATYVALGVGALALVMVMTHNKRR